MKYITDKSEISNYDAGFWDYLECKYDHDYDDDFEEKYTDDDKKILSDYSYLGLWHKGKLTEEKAKALLTQWGITCAYVMHYRGKSDSLWRSSQKRTCYHRELKRAHTYLDKYNLSKYRKIILLENFDEVVEFMTAMASYPNFARYLEFYLFCNDNYFLKIGHHDDIFIYQRNMPSAH